MSTPPPHPQLTPQLCFNTTILKDFLRLSRSSIDDSITQNLNALLTPSNQPFDPSSTSIRQPRTVSRQISSSSCQAFKSRVLFPSWQARSDVLNYCASVATSPDPEDPESVLREVESERQREKIVDERLDPYSARYFPREARTEMLASVVRQERGVEGIVRSRTWMVVGERCENGSETSWEDAMNEWRKSRERERRI